MTIGNKYAKTNWVENVTALGPVNLNKLEGQYDAAVQDINEAMSVAPSVLSGGTKIQSGISGTSGSNSVAITFPVAFSAAPKVICTCNGGSLKYTASSITATGCSFFIDAGTCVFGAAWIAIGT